jgi:hypothetical protein
LENGIQVKGMGMDPGFHRGDDKVAMEIKIKNRVRSHLIVPNREKTSGTI